MAFPENYIEQPKPCMKFRDRHQFSTTGHPLKHRCVHCHSPKWVEVIVPVEMPGHYIASQLSDVNP